ncbi:MATE family efflux transporter [Clostridium aestuarii]|uniref:Multidrug export protein MepA n=1 Tax=Clostridium aestuarii TaxID=338193 RepID=A0ABT4D1A0_9CLOT|nr:MATE family efflux transporter [Clostridium aestuarii]MCY6485021.1 MATE family efflux transporter [Clostridium aestuarii]
MNNRSVKLGNEDVKKLLIDLSLPAMIGMIVNALYNIVDTMFIGNGVGTIAIGALAIAFPIQMIIMAFGQMIGIGAAASVSINLGKGDVEKADNVAGNSFFAVVLLSTLIMIIGLVFLEPLLEIFGATKNILPYAKDYISVIFLGSIFLSVSMSGNNLIRAEGNAKVAMFSMLIGTGLNIILDPIFIYIFKLGIKGAAIATIISQFASFIFVISYLRSGKSILKIKFHNLKPDISILKEIFAIGSAAFGRQVAGSIVAIVINNSLKFYGTELDIAILGTVNKVIMFLYMPLFGIVQGMQPIVGFNYGAKKMKRVKETVKLSLIAATTLAGIGFIVSQTLSVPIMGAFSSDNDFIINGAEVLRVVVLMVPVVGIQIVGASLFQALGKAMPSLILSLLRQVILFIPLVIILPRFMGLPGIWRAFPIADFGATVVTAIFMINEMKKISLQDEKLKKLELECRE